MCPGPFILVKGSVTEGESSVSEPRIYRHTYVQYTSPIGSESRNLISVMLNILSAPSTHHQNVSGIKTTELTPTRAPVAGRHSTIFFSSASSAGRVSTRCPVAAIRAIGAQHAEDQARRPSPAVRARASWSRSCYQGYEPPLDRAWS